MGTRGAYQLRAAQTSLQPPLADGTGQDASRLGVNPRRVTGMARATPAGAWKIMAADLIFRGK
jgi:hypothetical protein